MALSAATATDLAASAVLIILVLTVVTLGYLLVCWLYPFTTCRRCHGTGRRRSPLGRRTFALCRRCHGDSHRLRPGRHLLNYLRAIHDKGTHHTSRHEDSTR